MSAKLNFRARALDISRPLPIHRDEDLPELPSNIGKNIQYVCTGMEKEEEEEKHLQDILTAQVFGLRSHQDALVIPTPEILEADEYSPTAKVDWKQPTQYIHAKPFAHEDYPNYDVDEEDVKFINEELRERWKIEVSESTFEDMIDQLEKESVNSVLSLTEAKMLLKEDDDLILLVYEYWLNKRLRIQHALIPKVRSERVGCNQDKRNPYVAFRRRTEKMQTRKNRKLDEASYLSMLKLRRDLNRVVQLLILVKKREKMKKAGLLLDLDIMEKRVDERDWDGHRLQEAKSMRFALQQLAKASNNKIKNKKKRPQPLSLSNLLFSEDETSVVDSDYESDHDSPFVWRRKEGVEYQAPRECLLSEIDHQKIENWPWAEVSGFIGQEADDEDSAIDSGSDDTFPWSVRPEGSGEWWDASGIPPYHLTYIPGRSVGYSRRRVGRGGRVLVDRLRTPKPLINKFSNMAAELDRGNGKAAKGSEQLVAPVTPPQLEMSFWDPYMARSEEVPISATACASNRSSEAPSTPATAPSSVVVNITQPAKKEEVASQSNAEGSRDLEKPPTPTKRRNLSGGLKMVNMDRIGAHNAATALINSRFLDLFTVGSSNKSD